MDSGNVDYIGTYWQASDGVRSIDLNGFEAAGKISQIFATAVGVEYVVLFDLSGNPDNAPNTKWVGAEATLSSGAWTVSLFSYDTSTANNSTTDMKWTPISFNFTASDVSTTLSFMSLIDGSWGPAIDNVRVYEASTVPEPGTMLLVGFGLAGLALFGRKKLSI